MKTKLLLAGLLISSPILANQQSPVPLSSILLSQFTIGLATGAIFTAGTMLWLRARAERILSHTAVGLIRVTGEIENLDELLSDIEFFSNSSQFYAILLIINSSGGNLGTAAALHRELIIQKRKKPIVVFVEKNCCAAAYYVASACDLIIASPCAEVGGIGVIYPHAYLDNPQYFMLEGAGIMQGTWQSDTVQAGSYKMAEIAMRPMNDNERQMEQNLVDDMYQTICGDIAQSRELSLTTTDQWADGQLFTARYASTIGLIDALGSLADSKVVLQHLFKDRGIKVPGKIVFLEKPIHGWLSSITNMFKKTLHNQAQLNIRARTLQ